MSANTKGKNKKGKTENETPQPTEFEIVYEQYVDAQSLTAAQQKRIVAAIGLSNHCLFDSLIIDLLTECLRFCKRVQFNAFQARYIYNIMQYLIFNCSENSCYDQATFEQDLKTQLESKLGDNAPTTEAPSKCIFFLQSDIDAVSDFMAQGMLSKFTLYRSALYEQNPTNLQYVAFKKQFEIGNVIRIGAEQCLFQIQDFSQHYVVIKQIEDANLPDVELCRGDALYFISKGQLPFISFVSKTIEQNEAEKEKEKENIDIDSGEKTVQTQPASETSDHEQEKELSETPAHCGGDEQATVITEKQETKPKTLIDLIVQEKVQQELRKLNINNHKSSATNQQTN